MSTFGISQQFTTSGVIGRFARESTPLPEKVKEVEPESESESEPESEYSDEDSDDQKYDDKKPKKVVKVKAKVQPKVETKEDTTSRAAHVMNYLLMASRCEERSADHM